MKLTTLITRIVGPVLLLRALSILIDRQHFLQMLRGLEGEVATVSFSFFPIALLMTCIAVVLVHSDSSSLAALLIRVIAWGGIVKASALMLFPDPRRSEGPTPRTSGLSDPRPRRDLLRGGILHMVRLLRVRAGRSRQRVPSWPVTRGGDTRQRMTRRLTARLATAVAAIAMAAPAAEQAQYDWLSLCGKCLSPSITSKSGIGTSHAVAEGKISRRDAEEWCASWEPERTRRRASARARVTGRRRRRTAPPPTAPAARSPPIDGETYKLAGTWADDIGKGRSKWRNASGQIVGQDNASNGLAISQQWEVLCPASAAAATRPGAAAPAPPKGAPSVPAAEYAVGQVIEAKYGRDWVRGRVDKIRQMGPKGGIEYEVRLDNGQRGIVPARMLRKPGDG